MKQQQQKTLLSYWLPSTWILFAVYVLYVYTYWRCHIMTRLRQVTRLIKTSLFWIQIGGLTLMLNENTWHESIISPKIHTNLLMVKMHSEKLEFNRNVGKIDQIHTPLSQLPAITWRHAGDVTLWASMFLRRQTCSNQRLPHASSPRSEN